MTLSSVSNPHLVGQTGENTPLQSLIAQALVTYGDGFSDLNDEEVVFLFLGFANQVVEDLRAHPYADYATKIMPYYQTLEQAQAIPDPVMVAGLLHYYALQQQNQAKMATFSPRYFRQMNQTLWNRHVNSGRSGPIRMRPVDGGSNLRHSPAIETTRTADLDEENAS